MLLKQSIITQWNALKTWTPAYFEKRFDKVSAYASKNSTFITYHDFKPFQKMLQNINVTEMNRKVKVSVKELFRPGDTFYHYSVSLNDVPLSLDEIRESITPLTPFFVSNGGRQVRDVCVCMSMWIYFKNK